MSTVHDGAKRAGVAPITVSRVIGNSGYISDVTRKRVEATIKEIGYGPNTLARGLRSKRTNTLALIVTDMSNPYFTLMAGGVEDVAGDSNYTAIYRNTNESESKEEKYANILAQKFFEANDTLPIFQVLVSLHVNRIIWAMQEVGENRSLVNKLALDYASTNGWY